MHVAFLIALAVVAIASVIASGRREEGLDAIADVAAPVQAAQLSAQIAQKVQLPAGSVSKVAFSNPEQGPVQASSLWATFFKGEPAYTADLTGRAKVVTTDNAIVVPSRFTVRGAGDTEASARADANVKAAAVISEMERYYASTGLLAKA